jgi:hypothetical protein
VSERLEDVKKLSKSPGHLKPKEKGITQSVIRKYVNTEKEG